MKNFLTIAYFEFKKIIRDWRLMLILLSEPVVIALIVGYMAYQNPTGVKVNVVAGDQNSYTQEFIDKLKSSDKLEVTESDTYTFDDIKSGKYRAIITTDISGYKNDTPKIHILNALMAGEIEVVVGLEVAKASEAVSKDLAKDFVQSEVDENFNNLKDSLPPQVSDQIKEIEIQSDTIKGVEIDSEYATPFEIKRFDYFASAMVVLLMLLVVLNVSAMSMTQERSAGTFERLFVTPYSKTSVILGKAVTHFALGILISLLALLTLIIVFHISTGSLVLLGVITILSVAMGVCLGMVISSITRTVVESVEVAMYAFFIAVLTSGIISPTEVGHQTFVNLKKILPFYYAIEASRRINLADAGWAQISTNVYYLGGFVIIFIILSILLLRREAR